MHYRLRIRRVLKVRSHLWACVATLVFGSSFDSLEALTVDLRPEQGETQVVPHVVQGAHGVALRVTGCPRMTVRSITVRGLGVVAPSSVGVIVLDGIGRVIAAGEAAITPGPDVSVVVPVAVTLEPDVTYGLGILYGDAVASYRLVDPGPAGAGGFPYPVSDGLLEIVDAVFTSPVILTPPGLFLPQLLMNIVPCRDEDEPLDDPGTSEPRFRRGDTDTDGNVNLSDAISTLRALFLGDGDLPCEDAADSNDDGQVDLSDVVTTLVALFVGTVDIPAPWAMPCGTDGTEDRLACDVYDACTPPVESSTIVNGVSLGADVIRALEAQYGLRVLPGDYWYDRESGAYGLRGGPTAAFILAGLKLGGPLPEDASNGDTGVFLNGRELPRIELAGLELFLGPIAPGRYWLDHEGSYGREGEEALGNLVAAVLAAQAEGNENGNGNGQGNDYLERTYFGSIGSDGQTSYFFDSSTGCSVISGGGVSC